MSENQKKATSCEELEKFINELSENYEVWYANSVRRNYRTYFILQGLSILAGVATGIISLAIPDKDFGTWKIFLVSLPFIGSLAALILIQFRIYDLWQIREDARIAFQDLFNEGRKRFAAATKNEECFDIHESLQIRVTAIEREQKERFFALNKSDFVATFKMNKKAKED